MSINAIEAVKSYAASQNLTPAIGGILDGQIGNNVPPPFYQQTITLQVSTSTCTVSSILFEALIYYNSTIHVYNARKKCTDLYIKLIL